MNHFLLLGEVADNASSVITSSDFQPIIESVSQQFNVTTVVGVLAAGVASAVGLAFVYWGARKLIGTLMKAFKKGKVSV